MVNMEAMLHLHVKNVTRVVKHVLIMVIIVVWNAQMDILEIKILQNVVVLKFVKLVLIQMLEIICVKVVVLNALNVRDTEYIIAKNAARDIS